MWNTTNFNKLPGELISLNQMPSWNLPSIRHKSLQSSDWGLFLFAEKFKKHVLAWGADLIYVGATFGTVTWKGWKADSLKPVQPLFALQKSINIGGSRIFIYTSMDSSLIDFPVTIKFLNANNASLGFSFLRRTNQVIMLPKSFGKRWSE